MKLTREKFKELKDTLPFFIYDTEITDWFYQTPNFNWKMRVNNAMKINYQILCSVYEVNGQLNKRKTTPLIKYNPFDNEIKIFSSVIRNKHNVIITIPNIKNIDEAEDYVKKFLSDNVNISINSKYSPHHPNYIFNTNS